MPRLTRRAWLVGLVAVVGCAAPASLTSPTAVPAPKPTSPPAPANSTSAAATNPGSSATSAAPSSGTPGAPTVTPLATRATIKVALNVTQPIYLPWFVAVDNGYFDAANLDVKVVSYTGASQAQFPLLVRGDINIYPTASAPAIFNQINEGFDLKVISASGIVGPVGSTALMLVGDAANQIKDYKDLKGRVIDAANEGAGPHLAVMEALRLGGLTPKDVTIQFKAARAADALVLMRSKAADVIGLIEPFASQAEKEGLATRWKTMAEIAPWYQQTVCLADDKFVQANRDAFEKLLEVYYLTAREVNGTKGVWTDKLARSLGKWSDQDPSTFAANGVPLAVYEPNGDVSTDSLGRVQDIWAGLNLVTKPVDVSQMTDSSVVDAVLKKISVDNTRGGR